MPLSARDTSPLSTLQPSPKQVAQVQGGSLHFSPQGREGSSLAVKLTGEKGCSAAFCPSWQCCAPLLDFPCTGNTSPGTEEAAREAVPAGPGSLLSVPCAGVGPCAGSGLPALHSAQPAMPLLTLQLHPKAESHWMRVCLASLGIPLPLALVGGPPQGTSEQLPSNPIQELVPAGLEMLYI